MNRATKALAVIAAVSTLGLAACAPDIREVPDPERAQSGSQSGSQSGAQSGIAEPGDVVLTEEQVRRIVADIQEDLTLSEEENDASILKERMVDPALSMRKGQFVRAKKTGTDLAPLLLDMSVFSATAGSSFPRVLVVASEVSGDDPAEVFMLTQKDARSDYKLENWSRLIGGTAVRGLSVREGSTVLEADATGLLRSPESTLETYVNYLNSPDNDEYKIFDDNVFSGRFRQELKALNEAIAVAGNVEANARVGKTAPIGVALDDGSALVSASFTYTNKYNKTVEGSTLELAGTPADYLEDPNIKNSATATYQVNIFFVIPPEGGADKISVVGAERVITSVTRDDGGE